MAFCGSCLQVSGYVLVVLISMLVYFHIECEKEKEETMKMTKEDFKPEETDVKNVPLGFCKDGESTETVLGISFMLIQSAPCAFVKFAIFITFSATVSTSNKNQPTNVTIYDARRKSHGSFHETGFTLVELDDEPVTTDWRTSLMFDENADVTKFHKQMEPHIMRLYPDTKTIIWTYNVVRGGDKFGDQPKAVGPHLDYHQNDTARTEFHKKWPLLMTNRSEPMMLTGHTDGPENGKLGVLLGVWKPIHHTVCDYPLAVMDSGTFDPDNLVANNLHMNFGFFTFHNLGGGISHSPEQKWFYYPFQTTKEVLIFHQYTKGKWLANPHTSFLNKNCPDGSESRISVEMRVGLYF